MGHICRYTQQDDSSVHVPDQLVHKYRPLDSGATAEPTTIGNGNR
jgi:hypothetical protein